MRRAKTIRGGPVAAGALAAACLTSWAAAAAANEHPVRIESEPPGATLSLGEGETIGETPFEGTLPAGVHTLIFQRDGYETGVEVIEVRASREPQSFSIELVELRYGSVEISAPAGASDLENALEGAQVRVDGEAAGEAPGAVQVPSGPHHLEIVKPGFEVFEAWVEITEGETVEVVATLEPDPEATIADEPAPAAPAPPAPAPKPPLIVAGGGVEFGGRTFRYENPQTSNLRPYDAGGVPLLRLSLELFPLSRTENPWLTGLSLVAGGAWAVPLDSSTEDGQVIGTSWSEYDVAARALFPIADRVRAGVEAAHGRARFAFKDAGELADEVPDVNYAYARGGAVASALVGRYDVRGTASFLSPYEAGVTARRFNEASVWGMNLAASVGSTFARHFDGRLTAHYTRFDYTIGTEPDASHRADGGVDHFFGLTLGGYFRY